MTGPHLLSRVLPDRGLPRRLATQSLLLAIGGGMFLTGSAVYFTESVGLSAMQIGIGFSVAGGLSLLLSVPMGALTDRVGPQRSWALGALAEAGIFLCYPLIRSFWVFLLALSLITVADVFAQAGRSSYTIGAIPQEIRVRTQAFVRSALNIGFTAGAGLGALVLVFPSHGALNVLVFGNAAGLIINAYFVSRLPPMPAVERAAGGHRTSRLVVFRDRPVFVLTALLGVSATYGTVFAEIIPLWSINRTDLPKPVLGALFTVNTIMAVLLQVPASRGANSLPGTIRLMRWGGLASAVAAPVVLLSDGTSGWVTIAVLGTGVVLVTLTELWHSSASWYLFSEVPPAERRGEYLGAMRMGGAAQSTIAPAALTYLTLHTSWGWWAVSAIFLGVVAATGPVIRRVASTPRPSSNNVPQLSDPTAWEAASTSATSA